MKEDWQETGQAVRSRAGEIAKETLKASQNALKTAGEAIAGRKVDGEDGPASQVPPESGNKYDVSQSIKDLAGTIKEKAGEAKEKVKKLYSRVEGESRDDPTERVLADSSNDQTNSRRSESPAKPKLGGKQAESASGKDRKLEPHQKEGDTK